MVLAAAGCATKRNVEMREKIVVKDSISYSFIQTIDTVYVPQREVTGSVNLDDLKRDTTRSFQGRDIRATVRYINNSIEVECFADSIMNLLVTTREKLFNLESKNESSTSVTETVKIVKEYPWRLIFILSAIILCLIAALYFNNHLKKFISWIRK